MWVNSRIPPGIYLHKVNNRNTRTRYKIYSKLTIETPRTTLVVMSLYCCSRISIVNFEHVIAGWDNKQILNAKVVFNDIWQMFPCKVPIKSVKLKV